MTRDKRIDAAPRLVLDDLSRVEEALAAGPGVGELRLVGRRHQRDCNSWMHNTERLTRGRARHHLLMHPEDLAERGIADGTTVTVTSRVGTVEVEVRASEDMMPGVVSLPTATGTSGTECSWATRRPSPAPRSTTSPTLVSSTRSAATPCSTASP